VLRLLVCIFVNKREYNMKNGMKVALGILAGMFFWVFLAEISYCDTIIKKDRERIKGVIVEDYTDRVVISTMDGELEILKSDVADINYDLEEQNLTSMGDLYQDRARYQEAYYFYKQALSINPHYKSAREGLDYSGSMIQQFGRKLKLDHISRMNEEHSWHSGVQVQEESKEDRLRRVLGFAVAPFGANFRVTEVKQGSPSYAAGLEPGDVIVAVWGRMVGYSKLEDFLSRVVSEELMEVRLTILRDVELDLAGASGNINSLMGAGIAYSESEGFDVTGVVSGGASEKAGLQPGDVIMEIEDESTRYMTLKDMEHCLGKKKDSYAVVKIKRELSIWKGFDKKK
jgi:membrane-associated protease RseP (regulator of RpoE activity)